MPKKGNIAFISQSGALCTSVLDWAVEKKIGFSYFISVGNMADIDFGDLIDYLGEDEKTESILLYIESITQARKFMTAARAFATSKPIIAYKAGRYPESAKVASSHTGAMASEDDVYDAAFKRIGLARVMDIGEIFDCAELIGRHKIPAGANLAVVTNAGGPGVMATDALIEANGKLAELSQDTITKLNESLPAFWSHANPVDVLGDAPSKRIAKAVQIVLEDDNADAVLVILTPQAMTNSTATAMEISKLSKETTKPIIANWMGGKSMSEGIKILNDNGIPNYPTPEDGVRAFMTLVAYSRNLKSLYETPRDIPVQFSLDRKKIREEFLASVPADTNILSEELSKKLISAYGIPSAVPDIASDDEQAVKLAREKGYPVVLKIHSKDITHKSDIGGVMLNIIDDAMVRYAYDKIFKNVKSKYPNAKIDGITVQRMIREKDSLELILGTKKDPIFGTVMMTGMGGTGAELFADKTLGFPPLNENLAMQMIESLKVYPLMKGYRGRPLLAVDKLLEILIRLSYLAADFPEISELDINPLLVTKDNCIALDARIILDKDVRGKGVKPYSHLALSPYPEEYVKEIKMKDGSNVILRPIKPEDEFLWRNLLASCSKETIYSRFRYFFHWDSHEAASRYCFIDYDREIAIVVESVENGEKKLLGVGRLVADPDHETVEYAVLVSDKWQDKGLGSIITDYCFDIAKHWGLKRIVAQTTNDNKRMISVFEKRGFQIEVDPSSSLVEVEKDLK
jgi:acetyltransferase